MEEGESEEIVTQSICFREITSNKLLRPLISVDSNQNRTSTIMFRTTLNGLRKYLAGKGEKRLGEHF